MNSAIRQKLNILGVLAISALIGAIITSYTYHRVRVWAAEGIWCTKFTATGRVERHYGSMCE